ncbi:Wzz/FepE/Etk N-terminal domain-containing protein [Gandjariella thermophila]|uniref:Membrane-bound polysaccharide biosynthesis protein n=1 Tax=Gandjariella thermophila TaxID=1931992 RepID=A0A4D4JCU9_9PSEU|nr:Wzz/FepE/Etk N-terminal domain-containing protein [Gandjariella thermophila]GDY32488.1 membrane-bound polysaccharide biosynthesis protein [Gandjariella thermophila]
MTTSGIPGGAQAGTPGAAPAAQPLLDLQRLVVAVRRRRRFWLSCALLGLLAGAAVAVLVPSPPTATAKLLVAHQADQANDAGTLIRTDVAVLETTRIAGAALQALHSDQRPEDFLKDYTGSGLTNNVLQITVQASSAAEAVARAGALADAFIADHVRRMKDAAGAQAQALVDQRDQARAELSKVDAAIADATSRGSRTTPGDLEALYARRAELTSQISDFGRRADEARIGTPQVAAGTQIVDAPRLQRRSLARAGATDAGIGLALGLVMGLAVTAVGTVVRDRPLLRREIAANLGASVIAQLPAARRGLALPWRRSRARDERRRAAATLARAVRGFPGAGGMAGSVSVLELGCARTAAALAMDLAEQLALDGPVVVVDDLPGRDLGRLGRGPERPIRMVDGGELSPGHPADHRERQVGVGSVAPGTAWTDLGHLGAETLLVVRAGHGSTAWLHTVARQLADLRIPVIGVVLVDPDPRDRTDGTLWDELHIALRGRAARRPAAPRLAERPAERPAGSPAEIATELPTVKFAPVRATDVEVS